MDASALSNSIAALRSSIRALESLSDSLEPWLYFWVTLVVIGVVLEVWFVLWAYREDFEAYHRGWIRSPQRPSRWKMFFELLGAGLVAIGVAGELGVDINAGRIQTDLRTKNGELVQLLQGVSGAAWESASKNAKEAARLAKEGEVLKKLAEDERLARVQLQKLAGWRTISAEQRRNIANSLRRFAGTTASFMVNVGDVEGIAFGAQIGTSLNLAGWETGMSPVLKMGEQTFGLWVTSTRDAQEAAGAVCQQLTKLKFDCSVRPEIDSRPNVRARMMWIDVGLRPIPPDLGIHIIQQF